MLDLAPHHLDGDHRPAGHRVEDGFTLIELTVVLLIIAILIAVTVPTFLGAREHAMDRAAQSDVRDALAAEKAVHTDDGAYSADVAALESIEPDLTFVDQSSIPDDADSDGNVYVHVHANGTVYVGARSVGGDCFVLRDDPSGPAGTEYKTDPGCGTMTGGAGTFTTGW